MFQESHLREASDRCLWLLPWKYLSSFCCSYEVKKGLVGTPAPESQDSSVHTTSVKAAEVSGPVLGELELPPQVGTEDGKQNSQRSKWPESLIWTWGGRNRKHGGLCLIRSQDKMYLLEGLTDEWVESHPIVTPTHSHHLHPSPQPRCPPFHCCLISTWQGEGWKKASAGFGGGWRMEGQLMARDVLALRVALGHLAIIKNYYLIDIQIFESTGC